MVIKWRTCKIETILREVDELVALIKDSEVYQNFLKAANKVEAHIEINEYVDRIKHLQKQRVNANYLEKEAFINKLNQEIDDLHNKLESIPLYNAYLEYKSEVEFILKQINSAIENSINKNINVKQTINK